MFLFGRNRKRVRGTLREERHAIFEGGKWCPYRGYKRSLFLEFLNHQLLIEEEF